MSRINRGIAVFLIYSAMAFAAWLPHSLHPGTSITDSWDGCLNAWILNWNLHQMDTGFPGGLTGYFNGNIMAPHPSTLAYSEHMLGVALAAWPLHRLVVPGNPLVIFNIMHLLSYVLCAGAMYLFIRRIGGSAPAGFAAGIMWAFSPWRYSQHGHFQLMSLYWLPLTLWALTAWIRTGKRRWPIAAAVFHLMQILSSYYLAVFHGVAIALYSIAVCIAPPVPGARKRLGIALMVLAGVSLLILPVTWPYFDIHESLAIGETEATVRALSAHPAMYLLPQPSGPVYRALLNVRNPGRYPPEQQVFPGFIVLAGAVIACVAALCRRRKSSAGRSAAAGFALLLILSGFVLSLGPGPDGGPVLPFHWFSRFVPGFGVVRVPARFAVLVQTGLVIAAAIGLDLAMRRPRNRRWIAGLAGIAVFLETAIWPAPSTR
ncbi:MAG TPA: hypothetical protein PLV45_12925, partial [bacterium]|nr:hypothetical protein [bacterium]